MTSPLGGSRFDVRMKGFRDRADVEEAVRVIDGRISALAVESVELFRAAGRQLAEPVIASVCVPGFDRSAMDGYAVRAEETFGATPYNELSFSIVGESLPGRPFDGSLGSGQAVRIMTGAPVPVGATAVVMAENAREDADRLYVAEAAPPGKNIGLMGEDIKAGETILAPPRTLRPQDLGVCAAVGLDRIAVVRQPRVSILVTGSELVPAGVRPDQRQIVDSNSVMLCALVERDGGILLARAGEAASILPDDRETIRSAMLGAQADCILVSGGSSVGKEDFAPSILAELGALAFHGFALRPAAPAGFGFLGDRPVFLLPGNPVSCLCAYDLFAGRAIRRLGGRSPGWPYPMERRRLSRKLASAVGRVDYARVKITDDGLAQPLGIAGASILSSTTRADGFVLIPKDLEGYPQGAEIDVFRYDTPSAAPRSGTTSIDRN